MLNFYGTNLLPLDSDFAIVLYLSEPCINMQPALLVKKFCWKADSVIIINMIIIMINIFKKIKASIILIIIFILLENIIHLIVYYNFM